MASDNPQENRSAPSEQRPTAEHSNNSQAEVSSRRTELESPVAKYHGHKSYKTEKHWLDYATLVVEILGLCGLGIYATLTYGIWCANKKAAGAAGTAANAATNAAQIASRTMYIDQRPWVVFPAKIALLVPGSPIIVPIHLANTGKTPAMNAHGVITATVVDAKENLDFVYTLHTGHPHTIIPRFVIFAENPVDDQIYAYWQGKIVEHPQPIILTPELQKRLADGKAYLVVHGRFDYTDVFGVDHWITFCSLRSGNMIPPLESPLSTTCTANNKIDTNELKTQQ